MQQNHASLPSPATTCASRCTLWAYSSDSCIALWILSSGIEIVERIDTAVVEMNELFNSLLDIYKLDAGVLTANLTDFPIAHLLGRLEATFTQTTLKRGLRLRVIPSSAWVRSDIILLERILLNFVSNAVRYTSRGGVLIGCRRRREVLRIEVWDSGPGIPEISSRRFSANFTSVPPAKEIGTAG